MSLFSVLLFLRESHFTCPRMPVILYFHRHNFLSQTLPHDFEMFLIHLEGFRYDGPKRSFHIQDLDAPFLYKLLLSHLGGRRIEFASRSQGFCWSFSTNIVDMRIPFQIICNRNTEIFDVFNIFKNCTLLGVGSLDFICQFSCRCIMLHLTGWHLMPNILPQLPNRSLSLLFSRLI